jgi:hypothetical protein
MGDQLMSDVVQSAFNEILLLEEEVSRGGEWLGAARRWMQSNVKDGDRLCWSSGELVHIPFCKLEDFAKSVAKAAIQAERAKVKKSQK